MRYPQLSPRPAVCADEILIPAGVPHSTKNIAATNSKWYYVSAGMWACTFARLLRTGQEVCDRAGLPPEPLPFPQLESCLPHRRATTALPTPGSEISRSSGCAVACAAPVLHFSTCCFISRCL